MQGGGSAPPAPPPLGCVPAENDTVLYDIQWQMLQIYPPYLVDACYYTIISLVNLIYQRGLRFTYVESTLLTVLELDCRFQLLSETLAMYLRTELLGEAKLCIDRYFKFDGMTREGRHTLPASEILRI